MLQNQEFVNENCCFSCSGASLSFWTNLYVCFFVRIMFVLLCKITGLATCIENVYMFVTKNTAQEKRCICSDNVFGTGAAAVYMPSSFRLSSVNSGVKTSKATAC